MHMDLQMGTGKPTGTLLLVYRYYYGISHPPTLRQSHTTSIETNYRTATTIAPSLCLQWSRKNMNVGGMGR